MLKHQRSSCIPYLNYTTCTVLANTGPSLSERSEWKEVEKAWKAMKGDVMELIRVSQNDTVGETHNWRKRVICGPSGCDSLLDSRYTIRQTVQ